jgi:prepilin-type N-terminal cleavage/methylation domain-containing protein
MKLISNLKESGGYSLVELIVVLTIFLIVIAVSVSIFISIIQQQKRMLGEQELLNQISFTSEYVSKTLRMAVRDSSGTCLGTAGYIYQLTHCNNGAAQACNGVKFVNQLNNNSCDEIFLDTTNPANPTFSEIQSSGTEQNLLSDQFNIKSALFVINGNKTLRLATINDANQPRITLLLDVQTPKSGIPQEKVVQTTVSERDILR